jgi:hypothetical protein
MIPFLIDLTDITVRGREKKRKMNWRRFYINYIHRQVKEKNKEKTRQPDEKSSFYFHTYQLLLTQTRSSFVRKECLLEILFSSNKKKHKKKMKDLEIERSLHLALPLQHPPSLAPARGLAGRSTVIDRSLFPRPPPPF